MPVSNFLKKLNCRNTRLFPKFTKLPKIIFSLSILILTFIVTTSIFAQNLIQEKQKAIEKGNNQESWLNESFSSNAVTMLNALGGTIPDAVLNSPATTTNWVPGGAIGTMTNLTASLFTPQASGIEYIAQIKNNFLGKPTYAQGGIGFQGLQPILPIWRTLRNSIYLLSSIFFIIAGIMIILRVKISPQATITLQSVIPKIITTLILVTFSYAIAGLIIDISYWIQALLIGMLAQSTPNGISGTIINGQNLQQLSSTGFWGQLWLYFDLVPIGAAALLSGIIGGIGGAFLLGGIGTLIAPAAGTVVGAIIGAGIGAVIVFLIIYIIIFIMFFKFFLALIKNYITVIIKIITAPFEIGVGAIPNVKIGFSSWITELIANVSVFPISLVYLVFVNLIISNIKASNYDFWTPTMLNGIGSPGIIGAFIGLGAVLLLPKIPELIPQVLFQLKPSPFGKAIGESFKGIGSGGIAKFTKRSISEEADYQVRTRITNPFFDRTEKAKEARLRDKGIKYKEQKPSGENS